MFFNFAEVMCELKETASRPSTQAHSRKSTFLFPVITELLQNKSQVPQKADPVGLWAPAHQNRTL